MLKQLDLLKNIVFIEIGVRLCLWLLWNERLLLLLLLLKIEL